VVPPLIELSVVPVASKKTKKGEMPVSRTALAFSVNPPLVPEQAKPAGAAEVTATVALCAADPPGPLQLRV
jgi:hypothetical protein